MLKASSSIKRRSQRDYSLGFKLSVVSQVEKGEMTYKQAQRLYGMQGRSTVLAWLRKHGNLDWRKPNLLPMPSSKDTPAQQIKRLQKELEDERLRNLILNEMVDRFDTDYNAGLRKKYLRKQSKNSEESAK